jgi:transcriptional regulator with XRE-family HTH domain
MDKKKANNNGGVERGFYALNVAALGSVVRKHREQAGIRVVDLAVVAGVDSGTVSRFEMGKSAVGIETIERIVTALSFMQALAAKAEMTRDLGDEETADDMLVVRPLFAKRTKGKKEVDSNQRLGQIPVIHPYARKVSQLKTKKR